MDKELRLHIATPLPADLFDHKDYVDSLITIIRAMLPTKQCAITADIVERIPGDR